MKTRTITHLLEIASICALLSCSNIEQDRKANDINSTNDSDAPVEIVEDNIPTSPDTEGEGAGSINFRSTIRPDYSNWEIGKTYTDTLQFLSFEDNYDYWYGVFMTNNGDTISLIYDEEIDDALKNRYFEVEWAIDSLYSAGEDEELYFGERLFSFKVLD